MLNLIKDSSRYSAARSCKIWSKRLGVIAENLCERREQSALSLSLPPSPFLSRKRFETKAVTYAVNNVRGGLHILARDRKRGKCSSCGL